MKEPGNEVVCGADLERETRKKIARHVEIPGRWNGRTEETC